MGATIQWQYGFAFTVNTIIKGDDLGEAFLKFSKLSDFPVENRWKYTKSTSLINKSDDVCRSTHGKQVFLAHREGKLTLCACGPKQLEGDEIEYLCRIGTLTDDTRTKGDIEIQATDPVTKKQYDNNNMLNTTMVCQYNLEHTVRNKTALTTATASVWLGNCVDAFLEPLRQAEHVLYPELRVRFFEYAVMRLFYNMVYDEISPDILVNTVRLRTDVCQAVLQYYTDRDMIASGDEGELYQARCKRLHQVMRLPEISFVDNTSRFYLVAWFTPYQYYTPPRSESGEHRVKLVQGFFTDKSVAGSLSPHVPTLVEVPETRRFVSFQPNASFPITVDEREITDMTLLIKVEFEIQTWSNALFVYMLHAPDAQTYAELERSSPWKIALAKIEDQLKVKSTVVQDQDSSTGQVVVPDRKTVFSIFCKTVLDDIVPAYIRAYVLSHQIFNNSDRLLHSRNEASCLCTLNRNKPMRINSDITSDTSKCFATPCSYDELRDVWHLTQESCKNQCSEMEAWLEDGAVTAHSQNEAQFSPYRYKTLCGKRPPVNMPTLNPRTLVIGSTAFVYATVTGMLYLRYLSSGPTSAPVSWRTVTIFVCLLLLLAAIVVAMAHLTVGVRQCGSYARGSAGRPSQCRSRVWRSLRLPGSFCREGDFLCECVSDEQCGTSGANCVSGTCLHPDITRAVIYTDTDTLSVMVLSILCLSAVFLPLGFLLYLRPSNRYHISPWLKYGTAGTLFSVPLALIYPLLYRTTTIQSFSRS
jgi:hypothetical protein